MAKPIGQSWSKTKPKMMRSGILLAFFDGEQTVDTFYVIEKRTAKTNRKKFYFLDASDKWLMDDYEAIKGDQFMFIATPVPIDKELCIN